MARVLRTPALVSLLEEKARLVRQDEAERAARLPPPREVFGRLREMEAAAYAERHSELVAVQLGLPAASSRPVPPPRKRRRGRAAKALPQ